MRRPVAGLLAVVVAASPAWAADGPNLLVEVGRAVAAAAAGETRDRPETVNDMIGGARVTGSGSSHAEVTVEFVPCDYRAVLDVVLAGTARTRTVGVNGTVRVNTNGLTQFAGRKRVWTDGERFEASPASVRVRQDSELTGVNTPFAGMADRLVSRIAARSFYRDQDENNREAAQLTERQITEEFDHDATQVLTEAERVFREQKAELRRRGLWPQDLRLSTTAEDLRLRGRLTGAGAAKAPPRPPEVVGRPDLAVRVHESVFNVAAAKHYGGRAVPGEELDRDFTSVLGPQTAGGRLDPADREQFSVTFAPTPLEASFAGRQVRAVVHTRGFTSEDRQITDPFDIRVAYDLARTPAGLVLTRRELEVLPADVAAGKRRMSLRENSLAKLLSKRFDKLLPAKQDVVLADLPGGLRKLGRLVPTQADADGGWLAVAWRRSP
ncbi:MAG TPA: hypothetical protein VGF55_16870 [Gemmataceae bacterium]|jgi:hypothetical protein